MTRAEGPLPFRLGEVSGDVHLPPGKARAPVVILCHGFRGFKDWGFLPHVADRIAVSGLAAIRMNFSMNGIGGDPLAVTEADRFAANTITRELKDLADVCAAVRKGGLPGVEHLDRRRIGLLGYSRGAGTVLVRALDDRGIRAVVTWASTGGFFEGVDAGAWKRRGFLEVANPGTKGILKVGYAAWEDLEAHRARYDFEKRLPWIHARTLFVHGRSDEAAPFEVSQRLSRRLADRGLLHRVDGGDHAFGSAHPFRGTTPALEEALRVTLAFLLENV